MHRIMPGVDWKAWTGLSLPDRNSPLRVDLSSFGYVLPVEVLAADIDRRAPEVSDALRSALRAQNAALQHHRLRWRCGAVAQALIHNEGDSIGISISLDSQWDGPSTCP